MQSNQENIKMLSGFKEFSIIGKGFIFKKHKEAILKIGGKIIDIVDNSLKNESWKEMVKKTKAGCIVILSPNYLHFEMVKFSSENGKIVLCEKPLTLKSEEARILTKYSGIFTVFQLRHHPLIKELKKRIKEGKNYQVEIDVSVHRDQDYWKNWKGSLEKSGGILFNLGIHYFDLLLYLFGEPDEISTDFLTEKRGEGIIKGKSYFCRWRINTEAVKNKECRLFKINGLNYDLFSEENLHLYVYKDFLKGKGVFPKEALKSIELIEKIYVSYR